MIARVAKIMMLGPSPDSRGGMSSVIETYRSAGVLDTLSVEFVPTYRDGSGYRKLLAYAVALGTVLWRIATGSLRLVHLHTASNTSFLRKASIAVACWTFRIPYLFHVHSGRFVDYVCNESGRVERVIARFVLSRAVGVIVLTESYGKLVRSQVKVECPVYVLSNPSGAISRRELSKERRRDFAGLRVVFLGLMTEEKGFFTLLEAVSAVRAAGLEIVLRCGGTGDIATAESECRRLRIDGVVHFLGWIDAERRLAELNGADVLVLPSHSEGQPMVIIEAMSAGIAIVASRVGGIPDTVTDGVEGLLVDSGEVGQLAEALRRLALDPELCITLGRNGRVRALLEHDPVRVGERLGAIYAEVLSNASQLPE